MRGSKVYSRLTEFPASFDALRSVGEWLRHAAGEAGVPEAVARGLDHALHEAVENVIRYAWREPAGRRIRVAFRRDGLVVEVEVADDGQPFDPRSVPARQAPTNLATLVPGGYGVAIMRLFADEIGYRRDGAYNLLTLRRRLQGSDGTH